ncbi:hypothetical protein SY88_22760 [Clostridiales bacterium PH28_bin88]|nr:hypothetical protein SY88_22760 [Clostridiales bacterium PH28_bin88]
MDWFTKQIGYGRSYPVILLRPNYRTISAQKTSDGNEYRIEVDGQFVGYIALGNRPEIGINVEANTLEEAKEQIKSELPSGFRILAESVLAESKVTVRGVGNTKEEALARARARLPDNASMIVTRPAMEEVTRDLEIAAFDE